MCIMLPSEPASFPSSFHRFPLFYPSIAFVLYWSKHGWARIGWCCFRQAASCITSLFWATRHCFQRPAPFHRCRFSAFAHGVAVVVSYLCLNVRFLAYRRRAFGLLWHSLGSARGCLLPAARPFEMIAFYANSATRLASRYTIIPRCTSPAPSGISRDVWRVESNLRK